MWIDREWMTTKTASVSALSGKTAGLLALSFIFFDH